MSNQKYYIVSAEALPEVFIKVAEDLEAMMARISGAEGVLKFEVQAA